MRESPFRENARQPDPTPEEDTSEEWFAKFRKAERVRRRTGEVGGAFLILAGFILCCAFCVWAVGNNTSAMQKCEAVGGTYLLREGKCVAVREIHP